MSQAEIWTEEFYHWDSRLRGYHRFETAIDFEPQYLKFKRLSQTAEIYDDGRTVGVVGFISKLLAPKPKREREVLPEVQVQEPHEALKRLTLKFPSDLEVSYRSSYFMLLNAISSYLQLSFEIEANNQSLNFSFVCDDAHIEVLQGHIQGFFPSVGCIIKEAHIPFYEEPEIAIVEFGLDEECIRPLASYEDFRLDPLTGLINNLNSLQVNESVLLQVLMKPVVHPWASDFITASSDGAGNSFFNDAPEMYSCAQEKISSPLFSTVIRLCVQGQSDVRTEKLTSLLIKSIKQNSQSEFNSLIPLSNEGYDIDAHLHHVYHRQSNRMGMILNAKELLSFVHFPNRNIVSSKLRGIALRSKEVQSEHTQGEFFLGTNAHEGREQEVYVDVQARLRHSYITGSTGVGKSTLIANQFLNDISQGYSAVLFDPHGDLAEDILKRIPEERKDDVIFINPSSLEHPIGFNILHAETEVQKLALSSDLVTAFEKHSTSWGDVMSTILANSINAFLESSKGGTLLELRSFLIDKDFRREFLKTVGDPQVRHYFANEFTLLRANQILPLLNRIDTFLRPKVVRYMLAQEEGFNFTQALKENKIVLINLAQGFIGESNCHFLGALLLSSFHQAAMGRQSLPKDQRKPAFLYLDEFHHFIVPTVTEMLSGVRKYGIGLTLAHQNLSQIDDKKLADSLLSNPFTRICFRAGEVDAPKLSKGFSFFEETDLLDLGRGEAIVRIGSYTHDCNIRTDMLDKVDVEEALKKVAHIQSQSEQQYGQKREEVEQVLNELYGIESEPEVKEEEQKVEPVLPQEPQSALQPSKQPTVNENSSFTANEAETFTQKEVEHKEQKEHGRITSSLATLGKHIGFQAHKEYGISNNKRVDLVLTQDETKIALEVSVTNSQEYELTNIEKCLKEDFTEIYFVCDDEKKLARIEHRHLELTNHTKQVIFTTSINVPKLLSKYLVQSQPQEKRKHGYRVKTSIVEGGTSKSNLVQKITKAVSNVQKDKG